MSPLRVQDALSDLVWPFPFFFPFSFMLTELSLAYRASKVPFVWIYFRSCNRERNAFID